LILVIIAIQYFVVLDLLHVSLITPLVIGKTDSQLLNFGILALTLQKPSMVISLSIMELVVSDMNGL
jgi:hypothetical protein